jgi:sRNA-binding carbon storage regulator CsrA
MLILSRTTDQEIVLTDGRQEIRIMVVSAGRHVRLGISAPDDWSILRPEAAAPSSLITHHSSLDSNAH